MRRSIFALRRLAVAPLRRLAYTPSFSRSLPALRLFSSFAYTKTSTGRAGLDVVPNAREVLINRYEVLIRQLDNYPVRPCVFLSFVCAPLIDLSSLSAGP